MHEMIKLRAKLEELNIEWIDSSDILSEDPIGYMTADDVIKYITDKLN